MARRRCYYGRKSLSDINSEAMSGPLMWALLIFAVCGGFILILPFALIYVIVLVIKEIYQSFK